MGALIGDIRFAGRQALSKPMFSLLVVGVLALGIGATTAIFSVLHAVLLAPLPFQDPDRLVSVWESRPEQGVERNVVSSGNYLDWKEYNEVFRSIGAYSHAYPVTLTGFGTARRISAVSTTPSMFATLGVAPMMGSPMSTDDADSVLVSHAFWRAELGADENAVGRTLELDGRAATVIGVLPPKHEFPSDEVSVWRPLLFDADDRATRKAHQWKVVARLEDDVTLAQAASHMRTLADGIREAHPEFMEGWGVNLFPLHDEIVGGHASQVTAEGGIKNTLWTVMVIAALTLAVACVNVAGLVLVRLTARRRELAIRKSVGASRRRLVSQVIVECACFVLAGVVVGVALAYIALGPLVAAIPLTIHGLEAVSLNGPAVAFGSVLAVIAVTVVGVIPALTVIRGDADTGMSDGARTATSRDSRLRGALIAVEIALASVLTAGALLLTHNLVRVLNVETGFVTSGLQLVEIPITSGQYGDTDAQVRFHNQVMAGIAALPGVVGVSGTAEPPLVGYQMTFSYFVEGENDARDSALLRAVDSGYFRTIGQPLLRGRDFAATDTMDSPPVAIVNESFAELNWSGESAIGKRISTGGAEGPWMEIVGVVGDTRHNGPLYTSEPAYYLAFAQKPWNWMSWMFYLVRHEPGVIIPQSAIRDVVASVDPAVAVGMVHSVEDLYAEASARTRIATALLGAFGVLSLVLGALGVYGLVSFEVANRRREYGVRAAMGASRPAIVATVFRMGMVVTTVGLAVGLAVACLMSGMMAGQLHLVEPADPLTFSVTPLVISSVAILALLAPAIRAANTDPAEALRYE